MAIDALGTPVPVSACFAIASIFSRSAAEIGAGVCACRSEVASRIKRQAAPRFPGRSGRFIASLLGSRNSIRPWVGILGARARTPVASATGSCRAVLGLDGRGRPSPHERATITTMALEEYKRKRRFEETPEPPPKIEKQSRHRFVVQRHDATRLHYDFRLEMEGVLKSWAVPKGPSLDPADKRLAMQVEDHPVSYYDFEGTIPEGNYGGGAVMVWDAGTWEPLSPVAVDGKYVPGTDAEAVAMLAKGDLKFRLDGKKLKGDFALVKMKGRRPGSKGNEWLMIKKHDRYVVEGYDIDEYDESVLSERSLADIAGDSGSREWKSRPSAGRGKLKAAWLADAVAKLDQKNLAKKLPAKAAKKKQKKKT